MANIAYTTQDSNSARSALYKWEAMGNADNGLPVIMGERADGSVQATGTWGGATLVLEGSNDGTNWFTLRDDTGSNIAITANALHMFMQRTWKVRVSTSGGTGTDVDVYLLLGS